MARRIWVARRRRTLRRIGGALSRRASSGDGHLHRRVAARRRADASRQARRQARVRPGRRYGLRQGPARRLPDAWSATLRAANIRAELYLGNPRNLGNQLKYADKRNAPCVVIQGSDEKAKGEVTIKDLIVGAELAKLEKAARSTCRSRPRHSARCRKPISSPPSATSWRVTEFRKTRLLSGSPPLAPGGPSSSVAPLPRPLPAQRGEVCSINGAPQSSSNIDACRAKGPRKQRNRRPLAKWINHRPGPKP